MDCETCKEKRKVIAQTPKDVPYIVHEGAVARLEPVSYTHLTLPTKA